METAPVTETATEAGPPTTSTTSAPRSEGLTPQASGSSASNDAAALEVDGTPADAVPRVAPAVVAVPLAADGGRPADARAACEHCGTTLEPGARFCPTCGYRVNVWRSLPDLGPDHGVSLVPASAAIQPGTEPSSRIPVRRVALAVGGIVVIAIAVVVGVLMLAPRPGASVTGSPGQAAAGSPSPATHELAVEVQLDQTLGAGEDPWSEVKDGGPCAPVRDAFPDIRRGTAVVVADESGTVVARSTLPRGRKTGPGLCSFVTKVPAPDATRYGIGIADRTPIVFSFDDLSQAGWTTLIKYVESP